MSRIMTRLIASTLIVLWICGFITEAVKKDETRPYEFSFNIEDFQHRYEKKDSEGIVTGEYGFITADGVYHETGYATDKNGDFKITRMKNRKITSLEVAQEIFKSKPEVAKRVIQVLAKSCGGCGIPVQRQNSKSKMLEDHHKGARNEKNMSSLSSNEKIVTKSERKMMTAKGTRKTTENYQINNSNIGQVGNGMIENTSNDLYYRFNYTITSHDHEETGYRNGKKDGSYRTVGINGTDAKVDYLSNEFGHQPNITFVNRQKSPEAEETLRGFTFEWIFARR